jgi:predicted lipoprotein with Yx(FWY)xxD motif
MHHPGISTRQNRPAWAAGLQAITAGLALTAALALAASAAGDPSRTSVRVGASHSARLHETILVNTSGRTLYHLMPESAHHIICTGACAKLWPPLLVRSRATLLLASSGVHGRLSIVRRPDGKLQVALNGLPLYTFARDHRPGDVKGQGFGGVWFVLVQRPAHHVAGASPPTVPPTSGGIPQHNGGDMDGDNNGAPSDGDGNQ